MQLSLISSEPQSAKMSENNENDSLIVSPSFHALIYRQSVCSKKNHFMFRRVVPPRVSNASTLSNATYSRRQHTNAHVILGIRSPPKPRAHAVTEPKRPVHTNAPFPKTPGTRCLAHGRAAPRHALPILTPQVYRVQAKMSGTFLIVNGRRWRNACDVRV